MGEKQLVRPLKLRIEESRETKKLYALERKRTEAIEACAREWARVVPGLLERHLGRDQPPVDHWNQAMPQALYDTLEAYATNVAICASRAYLEAQGYVIGEPVSKGGA